MRLSLLIFLFMLIAPTAGFSQDDYSISDPIDIPESGYNELILMRNGNTMLFHFENRKGIVVKVFDANKKEIAHQKHLCKIFDINAQDRSHFDKLFDINGDAVMFLTQEIENRETTVRLRFDATTGKLISEEKILQSPSFKHRIHTFFVKNRNSDDYIMLCFSRHSATEAEADIKIVKYNASHALIGEYPVITDNSKYDYIRFNNVSIDESGGILLIFNLAKIVQYPAVKDETLFLHYLPSGQDQFISKALELPKGIRGISVDVEYDSITQNNIILMTDVERGYYSSSDQRLTAKYYHSLFVVDKQLNVLKMKQIENGMLEGYLQNNVNNTYSFNGNLRNLNTNENGVITATYIERHKLQHPAKTEKITRCNLAIARYDQKGKEIWATIIPKTDLRYVHGDYPNVMGMQSEDDLLFTSCISGKGKYYLLFNDLDKNFDLKMDRNTDSLYRHEANLYSYALTNAIYYTIDDNNEVKKQYLFGKPAEGEYRHIYTSCYDYNKENNDYIVLLMKNIKNKNTIHLAWRKL